MVILELDKENQKDVVRVVAKILKQGCVVVFPTDTVYGLIADATDKKAVERIFAIKKREKIKSLPVFIKSLAMAKRVAKINKEQEEFLEVAWPGKVTVRLERKSDLKMYGLDKKTICLRIPNYELLNELLDLVKIPLAQSSANLSGNKNCNDIKNIMKQFKNEKPDIIVSTGKLNEKSSTIIDLTVNPPTILR